MMSPLIKAFGKLKGIKPKTKKTNDELLNEVDKELDPKDV